MASSRGIDAGRLLDTLEELSQFGADEQGGVSRPGFSDADRSARDFMAGWAARHGLAARVDQAGNLVVGRHDPREDVPVLLIGSHLDTVVRGGKYDGAYGVVAAFEVLANLAAVQAPMRFEPRAVAFANEEGAWYPCPFFGSRALIGDAQSPEDIEGLRKALAAFGGDPDRVELAAWPHETIGAYLELHVEQGPVLERQGANIGVVEAIVGRTIFDVVLYGQQNHAGTTPMDGRRDALVAAAHLVLAVQDLARSRRLCSVSTVGVMDIDPNVANVVPGEVRLTIEIRDTSPKRLVAAERAALKEIAALAPGVRADVAISMRAMPVTVDGEIARLIDATARELGLRTHLLASGAGHDAQIVGTVAPIGMIFVPSKDGISHAPEEHTEPDDLVAGANVLWHTARRLLAQEGH